MFVELGDINKTFVGLLREIRKVTPLSKCLSHVKMSLASFSKKILLGVSYKSVSGLYVVHATVGVINLATLRDNISDNLAMCFLQFFLMIVPFQRMLCANSFRLCRKFQHH